MKGFKNDNQKEGEEASVDRFLPLSPRAIIIFIKVILSILTDWQKALYLKNLTDAFIPTLLLLLVEE